jgi:hypothetical protein
MNYLKSISKKNLEANYCFEKVDRVPNDPETTAFKQMARLHQSLWREKKGLPIGSQPMRPKPGQKYRSLGSRIDLQYAERSEANFLTNAAKEAVRHRVANPEPKQTLNLDRLYADLLSSMPMCFNLFGPLFANNELATNAVRKWWPDALGHVNKIRFEWSPGRQITNRFLENRSAFDVAFEIERMDGELGVIGIETKYHEDCHKEKNPSEARLRRYNQVAEDSGVFKQGASEYIVGTNLQQIWLDHLLALSMLQDSSRKWTWVKFVLIHPSGNPSFAKAAKDYFSLLKDTSTFEVRTIESLFKIGVFEIDAEAAFRERYFWCQID